MRSWEEIRQAKLAIERRHLVKVLSRTESHRAAARKLGCPLATLQHAFKRHPGILKEAAELKLERAKVKA
jgi:transcriptional regulator with GAF, ATPase, and Fis domain